MIGGATQTRDKLLWRVRQPADVCANRKAAPLRLGQGQPEVWVTYPEQEAQAREMLYHLQHVQQRRWMCVCGELVEGGFEQCWNCQALMPAG